MILYSLYCHYNTNTFGSLCIRSCQFHYLSIFTLSPRHSLSLSLSLSLSPLPFPISMMFSALLIFFILTVGNHSNAITVYSLLIYNSFCFYPNVCSHRILMNVWYARVSKKQLWWSYEDFSKRSTKFNDYLL